MYRIKESHSVQEDWMVGPVFLLWWVGSSGRYLTQDWVGKGRRCTWQKRLKVSLVEVHNEISNSGFTPRDLIEIERIKIWIIQRKIDIQEESRRRTEILNRRLLRIHKLDISQRAPDRRRLSSENHVKLYKVTGVLKDVWPSTQVSYLVWTRVMTTQFEEIDI